MSRKDTIMLLGLCAASLFCFVTIGSWWASPDQPALGPSVDARLGALESKARLEPTKVENFARLGAAYKATGRLREAVSAYVSASELAPGNAEVRRALISLKAMAEVKGRH
jgi:cytochrome c-type biogenesis protein CcmH/NrfG